MGELAGQLDDLLPVDEGDDASTPTEQGSARSHRSMGGQPLIRADAGFCLLAALPPKTGPQPLQLCSFAALHMTQAPTATDWTSKCSPAGSMCIIHCMTACWCHAGPLTQFQLQGGSLLSETAPELDNEHLIPQTSVTANTRQLLRCGLHHAARGIYKPTSCSARHMHAPRNHKHHHDIS